MTQDINNQNIHNNLYDSDNIFAKILKKEIPSIAVYEDESSYAFMDLMPQSEGHVLLIPKTPSRNILDADTTILPHLIKVVQKLAIATKKALSADGITLTQFNEKAAGQTVYYLHFHIIPRYENVDLKSHNTVTEKPGTLEAIAKKIRLALNN